MTSIRPTLIVAILVAVAVCVASGLLVPPEPQYVERIRVVERLVQVHSTETLLVTAREIRRKTTRVEAPDGTITQTAETVAVEPRYDRETKIDLVATKTEVIRVIEERVHLPWTAMVIGKAGLSSAPTYGAQVVAPIGSTPLRVSVGGFVDGTIMLGVGFSW